MKNLTQRILNKTINNKKTELGVGFGGEPEPKEKPMVYRNDTQKYNQYPKPKSLLKPLNKIATKFDPKPLDRMEARAATPQESLEARYTKKPLSKALNKFK